MSALDSLLAGVEQAVGQAKREAAHQVAAAHSEALAWQQRCEELERCLQQQQEQQLPPASPQQLPPQPSPSPLPSNQQRQQQQDGHGQQLGRRHTAPALRSTALAAPGLYDQLSSTASRLEALRQELERDLQQGQADGTLTLSRLSSLLHACSFLRDASAAACSRRNSQELGRQDGLGEQEQEVALHDDGGAGVGATAAAAVSVALAQSWAAAAGARQASLRHAAAAEGAVRPGKARFKLVAAVPRSYRQQQQRRDRQAGSMANGSSVSLQQLPSTAALRAGLPPKGAPVLESTSALVNLAEAEPNSMDDAQEATWRASGQHLKLQWLSAPSTVLVVYKPVPAVFPTAVKAVAWLVRRGMAVHVEPGVHGELLAAVQDYLEEDSTDGSSDDGIGIGSSSAGAGGGGYGSFSPGSAFNSPAGSYSGQTPTFGGRGGMAGAAAAGAAGAAAAAAVGRMSLLPRDEVDLPAQLLTWPAPPCGCPPAVPCSVGHQVDVIITLGGDGTVLWTCGLFAAGAVPPIVPFAMGSLGFMTPFDVAGMEAVLSRVTSTDRGVPLMLRHRLQCRIIRGSSSPDLAAQVASSIGASSSMGGGGNGCNEEFVVLNEVVIDRGMKAQLCNLQCYADQNHVTAVQGDGLIVATPTGSTAYSLAAGGSMVHPAVPCFLFTPICPHSLASRPLVFPEHVTLRVKVPLDSRSGAYCSFDGKNRQELRPGDSVLISMSQWPAPMVCNLDASHDWFLSMREGLSWNVRKQQAGKGQ